VKEEGKRRNKEGIKKRRRGKIIWK